MVYSTFLPSGTTQVILPSTLSGSFEIRLVGDTYYYRGVRAIIGNEFLGEKFVVK